AIVRLAELLRGPDGPVGAPRLLDVEHAVSGEFLLDREETSKWSLPGWERLRAIGGEITVVSALASEEDLAPGQPLFLSGVFEGGALFQVSFLPHARQPRWCATATGERGRVELLFPVAWQGPAF